MGLSENVVYPIVPNGFADHYPVFKWLFHWEYTLFSDKPMSTLPTFRWGIFFLFLRQLVRGMFTKKSGAAR